jgi:hypothetical protein
MVSSSASFLRGNTDGSSNQGVTSTGDTSDDTGDTILKVDGQAGSSVSDLALERWLLADVGLRSQQVLAQAGSSSMFTVASQAGYDDQNPGISVDLQALSEPGELVMEFVGVPACADVGCGWGGGWCSGAATSSARKFVRRFTVSSLPLSPHSHTPVPLSTAARPLSPCPPNSHQGQRC